jgi:hypothetical protein
MKGLPHPECEFRCDQMKVRLTRSQLFDPLLTDAIVSGGGMPKGGNIAPMISVAWRSPFSCTLCARVHAVIRAACSRSFTPMTATFSPGFA